MATSDHGISRTARPGHAVRVRNVDRFLTDARIAVLGAALAAGSAVAQDLRGVEPIGTGTAAGTAGNPAVGGQQPGLSPRKSYNLGFGLTTQVTFSDNFNLAPEGSEVSGRAIELSPYLEGYLRTAKSRGDLSLRLRGLWSSAGGSSDSTISPDVRARGDLSISDDDLRVAASALVFRNTSSPFAASSSDPASRPTGTDLYKAYAVSPYSLGRIGNSDYELRYQGQFIDPGGSQLESTSHQVSAGLSSRQVGASAWGWSAQASENHVSFEDDSDFTRGTAEALGYYGVTPALRLGAGVNFSRIDVLTNSHGDNSGFGPTAFLSWRPGPRTLLTAKYSDTYYGSEASARFTHRLTNWLFGATYVKGLQTGNESGLLYFDPNAVFSLPDSADVEGRTSVRSLADRRLFNGAGQSLLFGQTGSALVFNESTILSVAYSRPRYAVITSLFANEQKPAQTSLNNGTDVDLKQRGANLNLNYRLTPLSSVFINSQYALSESARTSQETRLSSVTTGWQLSLSREMLLSASVRAARQTSEGSVPGAEYEERAAFVSIDYRF